MALTKVPQQVVLFGLGCFVGFLVRDFTYWHGGLRSSSIHWMNAAAATGDVWQVSSSVQALRAEKALCPPQFSPAPGPPAVGASPAPCPSRRKRRCDAWKALLKYFRWRFPRSHFTEEVPKDLQTFWDFAHQVFFGEGWDNMPGPHTSYSLQARRTLPGPHEGGAVQAGRKRPGTLNGFYMGQAIQKYPFDMWLYMEIFWDLKPDVIVECGTFNGAAAAWYGMVMQLFKPSTKIISIDIIGGQGDPVFFRNLKQPNVQYLRLPQGDIDPVAVKTVQQLAAGGKSVMVFLDSNHHTDHVYKQLEIYSKIVTVGSYMIVEDTNIDMNPVCQVGNNVKCGGSYRGPHDAVQRWLPKQDNFVSDLFWGQVYHISQNPNSWLRRVK